MILLDSDEVNLSEIAQAIQHTIGGRIAQQSEYPRALVGNPAVKDAEQHGVICFRSVRIPAICGHQQVMNDS